MQNSIRNSYVYRMQERHLEHFLAIVDAGSISGAAIHLGLTQPGLSQSISALERDLGVELFRRSARHTALTPAGREFMNTARRVVHELAHSRSMLMRVTRNEAGTLRVACPSTLAVDPLTYLFGAFRRRHPRIWLEMRSVAAGIDGADLIRDGSADIALDLGSPSTQDMSVTPLGDRGLLAVLPDTERNEDTGVISIPNLLERGLVTSLRGGSIRQALETISGADIVARSIAVETEHEESVLPLVLGGAGAAVLPDRQALLARDTLGLRVVRLDPPITQPLVLLRPPDAEYASALAFVEIARDAMTERTATGFGHG